MGRSQLHTIIAFEAELGAELPSFIQNAITKINKSAIFPKLFQILVSDLVSLPHKTSHFLHNQPDFISVLYFLWVTGN